MQVTLLSHASLWIEHGGARVLVDPWLTGTCYDGAWALCPDDPDVPDRIPRPDWILYSHRHPDHLHLPTLRALASRFGPDLQIGVARDALGRTAHALRALGFSAVHELPLGRDCCLGGDLWVSVHAVRADDTTQVFRAARRTVVNANDCRLEGRVLRRLAQLAAAPDLLLGQFSIGDAFPFRLAGLDPAVLRRAAEEPLQLLLALGTALRARHIVPFAGFFRFAHADNAEMNRFTTTLGEVAERTAGDERVEILYPGDGWGDVDGFTRATPHRERYERAVAAVHAGTLPLSQREAVPPAGQIEAAAERRFRDMFSIVPRLVRRRMGVIAFHLDDAGRSLAVDWPNAGLSWSPGAPSVPFYRLGAGHFTRLCASDFGWSTCHVGARFSAHGWRDGQCLGRFFAVSLLYEMGYFQLGARSLLRRRLLATAWARRAEVADLLSRLARGAALRGDHLPRL